MAYVVKHLMESPDAFNGYFIVGEEEEKIGVVKELVARCSPVFHKMLFESDMKETGDVHMPDIHPEALKIFLKFAYGATELDSMKADMTGWSPQTCERVVDLAEKYEVPELQDIALYQLKPITVDNLFPALRCVVMYEALSITADVTKFVQNDTRSILKHRDFVKMTELCLIYILKQDILEVGEVELWQAVLSWARHQVQIRDDGDINEVLKKPLQHIRLLTISFDDIYKEIEPSKIFSLQDFMDLSKAIANKTGEIAFCSNNRTKRITLPITVNLYNDGSLGSAKYSSYRLDINEKGMELKSILCHKQNNVSESFDTTVTLTVTNMKTSRQLVANCSGQLVCKYNKDIEITPAVMEWPPIQLEPHGQYRLDLAFQQYLPAWQGPSFCAYCGQRYRQYKSTTALCGNCGKEVILCSGHNGNITSVLHPSSGVMYSHVKEMKFV